jgi:RNA polymerase sigma-70 factor (TIGR02943 family)
MKLLLIEDEHELAVSIRNYLKGNDFVCEWVNNASKAIDKISLYNYDCILLDLMLPDGNGFDILKELKSQNKTEGVIIISAKENIETRIEGFNLGADDYLTKPFHLSELLVRILALIRRKNFKGNSSERTWFVSILKRKLIDHYRKTSRKDAYEVRPGEDKDVNFDANGHWLEDRAPADWGNHPEKAIHQNEFMRVLQECLSFLSTRAAAVFTMKEIDNEESDNICKELDISPSNLWVLLHRARTQLRSCLEAEWFENSAQGSKE